MGYWNAALRSSHRCRVGRGLRNFVAGVMGRRVECQLDWFHIGVRLERLCIVVWMPVIYAEHCHNPNVSMPIDEQVTNCETRFGMVDPSGRDGGWPRPAARRVGGN